MACLKEGTYPLKTHGKSHVFLLNTFFVMLLFFYLPAAAQQDTTLKNTLPAAGKMKNDKPSGKGWENLLLSGNDWEYEPGFWQLKDHLFHGTIGKEKEHHYSYTKKSYKDFELNVLIKMVGDEDDNSGV